MARFTYSPYIFYLDETNTERSYLSSLQIFGRYQGKIQLNPLPFGGYCLELGAAAIPLIQHNPRCEVESIKLYKAGIHSLSRRFSGSELVAFADHESLLR